MLLIGDSQFRTSRELLRGLAGVKLLLWAAVWLAIVGVFGLAHIPCPEPRVSSDAFSLTPNPKPLTPNPTREFPPAVLPTKPVALPTLVVRALPNGLKIVIIERHALPLLTLRLVVKAGAEADPPELPGTAQFVAALLNRGTATRSARAIAETIDSAGGTIETGADWDSSIASVSVLADHAEPAFDLVSDMVIRPAFAPAEVERKRQQTLSALKVARGDPAYVADAVFRYLVFAGTLYSHPEDGTAEALQKITPQHVRDFHARYYRPSNSVLAVVGDISPKEAFEQAEKFWGNWADGSGAPVGSSPAVSVGARQAVVVDKPDAVQTEIRVGNPGVRRDSPEYYALAVANQVLGGPGGNRLFKALRSREGLTYSASSDLVCHRAAGSWTAKTFTRTPETMKSLHSALEQMKRLRQHPITQQELETAQGYLIGHLTLEFESSEDVAARFLELIVEDLSLDYWNQFPEKIRAVTAEDVLTAARRYLDPKRNIIVLVGNAAAFASDLRKLGPSRVIPLASLDFASTNLERPAVAAGKR